METHQERRGKTGIQEGGIHQEGKREEGKEASHRAGMEELQEGRGIQEEEACKPEGDLLHELIDLVEANLPWRQTRGERRWKW